MQQNHTANIGEEIHGVIDLTARTCAGLEIHETGKPTDNFISWRRLHSSFGIRYEAAFLTGSLKWTRHLIGKGMEACRIHVGVNGSTDLRVAPIQPTDHRHPVSIAAMSTAIHLDETGTITRHHNFSMGRTMLNLHSVKHTSNIWNNNLGFLGFGINRLKTKVDECRPIGLALVVNPAHCRFVDAIERNMVDNIFLPTEELLAQHSGMSSRSTNALLRVHQQMEVLLGLLEVMAQLDAIRTSRFDGFEDHGILFGAKELFHVRKVATSRLTDGSKAGCLDQFLLQLLVATLGDVGAVREETKLLRKGIAEGHATFAAADAGLDLEGRCGLGDCNCSFGQVVVLIHLGVIGQTISTRRRNFMRA